MEDSINWGTWMVYNGTSQSNMDDLGVPLFEETSIYRQLMDIIEMCHSASSDMRNTRAPFPDKDDLPSHQ